MVVEFDVYVIFLCASQSGHHRPAILTVIYIMICQNSYKMLKNCGIAANKVWKKLAVKKRDGSIVNLQMVDLPNDRFEDFMDFKMEYYVKNEITHRVAGIWRNVNAMAEYRQYFTSIMKNNPSYAIIVCYPEQNGIIMPEIIGMSIAKLIKIDEIDYDTSQFQGRNSGIVRYLEFNSHYFWQLKTKEVKKFFDILRRWNDLCPVPDVMRTHGVETYYDDGGFAVRPDYYGAGLANMDTRLRIDLCKENGVPMTGAWMTSPHSAKAAANNGWVSVYEINYDELSKKLGVTFDNPPLKSYYMIGKH